MNQEAQGFFANVKQTARLMINSPGHVITSLQSFWHGRFVLQVVLDSFA
jgi:hypothetical protein